MYWIWNLAKHRPGIFSKCFFSLAFCTLILMPVPAHVEEEEEEAPPRWETTIALGMNLAKGNSDILSLNVGLDGLKETEKHDYILVTYANYSESDGEKSSQNALGQFIYRRKFNRAYLYTDNRIGHDRLGDIKYRLTLGGGAGYFVVQNDQHKLGLEGGLAYQREEIYAPLIAEDPEDSFPDLTDNSAVIRFGQNYNFQMSDTSRIWQFMEFLPRANDFSDYLFNIEAGVESALNSFLSLRFVVQNRYNSEPPPDIKKNDFAMIAGIGIKF